jgi:glycosyltransferase involved in cell wall biosynthesis
MGVGAVTVTTDAPPMNELVDADRGILVPYARTDTQFLANTYFFDEAAAEAAIERMIAMPEDEMQRMGNNARAWFLRNDRLFSERLRQALVPLFA